MMQQPQSSNMLNGGGGAGGGGASPDSKANRKTRKKRAQKLRSKKKAQAAAAEAMSPVGISPPPASMMTPASSSASVSISSSPSQQSTASSSVSVSFFRRRLAVSKQILASVTRHKKVTILDQLKTPININKTPASAGQNKLPPSLSSSKKGLASNPQESPTSATDLHLLGIQPHQSPFMAGAAQTLSSTIHACFNDDEKNNTKTKKKYTNAAGDSPSGTGSMTSSSRSQSQDFLLGIQQCFYRQHQQHEQKQQVEQGIPTVVPSCDAEEETEIVFTDDEGMSLDKQHQQQRVEQCIPTVVPSCHAEEETVFSDDEGMSLDSGSADSHNEEEEESVFKSAWSVNTSTTRDKELPPVMSVSIRTSSNVAAHHLDVNKNDDKHLTTEDIKIKTPMNAYIVLEPMMTPTLFPFNNDPIVQEEAEPLRSDYGPTNEKKQVHNKRIHTTKASYNRQPPAAAKTRLATPTEAPPLFQNKKSMDQDGPEPLSLDNDYGPTLEKKRVRNARNQTRATDNRQPPAATKTRLAAPKPPPLDNDYKRTHEKIRVRKVLNHVTGASDNRQPPAASKPRLATPKPTDQGGPEPLPLDNDYRRTHEKIRMRKGRNYATATSDNRQPPTTAQTPTEVPMIHDGPEPLPLDNDINHAAVKIQTYARRSMQRRRYLRILIANVETKIHALQKVAAKDPAKRKMKARITESKFWTKPAERTPERAPGAKEPLPSHKVYLLLLQPASKKFELIVLRYTVATTTIGDILDLIPHNATEAILGSQRYTGLAQTPGSVGTAPSNRSKSKSSTLFWTDLTLPASSSWKNQKNSADIDNGDILVAIPDGYTGAYVTGISKYILKNARIQELIGRATVNPAPTDPSVESSAKKDASLKSSAKKDASVKLSATKNKMKTSSDRIEKRRSVGDDDGDDNNASGTGRSNRNEKRRSVGDDDGDDDAASGSGGSKRSRSNQQESVASMDSFLPQGAKAEDQSIGNTTPIWRNDQGVPRALFNMAITTSPATSSTATFEKNLQKQKSENPFQPAGRAVEFVFNAPAPVATGQGVLYNYNPSGAGRFVPKERHEQFSSWSQSFNNSVSNGHSLTSSTKRKRRAKCMKKMKLGCLAVVSLMVLRYLLDPLGFAARDSPAVAVESSMSLASFTCCFAVFFALAKFQKFMQTNMNPSESKCVFMQSSASVWERLQQQRATITVGR